MTVPKTETGVVAEKCPTVYFQPGLSLLGSSKVHIKTVEWIKRYFKELIVRE